MIPKVFEDIFVDFIHPPIPLRSFDYAATSDGYEPGDPIGYGATRDEAAQDLIDQLSAR